jgi:hypothetical protein
MEKYTAVEWLYLQSANKKLDLFDLLEAKAMEKEQIVDAYNNGENRSAELYYNETYKGGQDA